MANFGVRALRIVGKREDFNDFRVRKFALHASPLWEGAAFFDSLPEALGDCMISFGTTRRRGKKRKGKLLLPEDFTSFLAQKPEGPSALVFGNERTGLTDEEIAQCSMAVTIPASEDFPSLNLSHAVQILCYCVYRAALGTSPGYTPVTLERIGKTVTVIADSLGDIGFFSLAGRPQMERFWQDLLARAALTEGEAAYLEKIFTKAAGLAAKSRA
jgi:tRNA/rRNA methyltransferase